MNSCWRLLSKLIAYIKYLLSRWELKGCEVLQLQRLDKEFVCGEVFKQLLAFDGLLSSEVGGADKVHDEIKTRPVLSRGLDEAVHVLDLFGELDGVFYVKRFGFDLLYQLITDTFIPKLEVIIGIIPTLFTSGREQQPGQCKSDVA